MNADRSLSAWSGLQDAQDPMGLYARTYRAKVVAQTADADQVDVRPDDARLPDMAKVPLRHGVPGLRVQVAIGSYLLVGWDDGRPDRPFAALWNPDVHAIKVSVVADLVNLGDRTLMPPLNGVCLASAIEPLTGLTGFLLGWSSKTVLAKP